MRLLTVLLASLVALNDAAQDFVPQTENITTDGIPPVPVEVADRVDRYGNFRSASFAEWHPERLEMLITTRFGDTSQVHRVRQPMGMREQITFFDEPVLGVGEYARAADHGDSFTLTMDVGGDEFYQLYRFDTATGDRVLLTDGKSRHSGGPRSEKTGLIAFQRVDSDADGAFTEFWTVDPLKPNSAREIVTMRGGGWGAVDWSPNGKQLLLREYISVTNSRLWMLDVEKRRAQRILPKNESIEVLYGGAEFAPDGKSFYVTSDERGEFSELMHFRLDTLEGGSLTSDIPHDVDDFDLSPDGKWIAYTVNAGGFSKMYTARTDSPGIYSETSGASLIGGLKWHNDSDHLAFTTTDARSPGDVWVRTNSTGEFVRWTQSETGIPTAGFRDAEFIEWESFDGKTITGIINRPPKQFDGKRPVVVVIHGGPEGQSRPNFLGRWNYFLNELGVALIHPNVRGSTGFGKTFVSLDNGTLREGTYEDIGALLDWIGEQPDLDASRIMIYGGSYGGHMTLATATRYSDKIACSVNLYGISNLRTFLENTQGYRRDLRRAEYGDERDPDVRAWMERAAPMAHVRDIRKPMLVQQGVNDPRVPKSESDQIVAALKETGTPVWYLVFDDEGHGWRKKPNADYAFYSVILFAEEYLLGLNR